MTHPLSAPVHPLLYFVTSPLDDYSEATFGENQRKRIEEGAMLWAPVTGRYAHSKAQTLFNKLSIIVPCFPYRKHQFRSGESDYGLFFQMPYFCRPLQPIKKIF